MIARGYQGRSMTPTIVSGDLLDQPTEAIVNPWNRNLFPWWLLLPQGVSGAIKRKAGVVPFQELRRAGLMRLGQAFVTSAGKLPYKAIIHVAGINLLWRSSEHSIRASTENALRAADEHGLVSLAFPLIGTGSGGFDSQRAERLMIDTMAASPLQVRATIVRWQLT
jgi:O-acetyl-ADP-ribose deacetylase